MREAKLFEAVDVVLDVAGWLKLWVKVGPFLFDKLGAKLVNMGVGDLCGLHDITNCSISEEDALDFHE